MASAELVIHDLITEGKDSAFDNKNLLKPFLQPTANSRVGLRNLCQPDGSIIQRTVPEKMRSIPQFVIFDTRGQEIYQALMQEENDYYLTACEKKIIETKAKEICSYIPDNANIFDLGCGSMEKTKMIIDHLRKSGKKGVKVYGVDIDEPYLKTVLTGLIEEQKKNKAPGEDEFEFTGLHATYEQALPFMKKTEGPKVLLVMGSTIGSMNRKEAIHFMHQFQEHSMEPGDSFFLGFDKRKDPKIVAKAYQDSKGYVFSFCTHGLENLQNMLGKTAFLPEKFQVIGGYNDVEGCNELMYKSLEDQTVKVSPPFSGSDTETLEILLKKGELIDIITSFKYSQKELEDVVSAAKFKFADQWSDPKDFYWFCLLKC